MEEDTRPDQPNSEWPRLRLNSRIKPGVGSTLRIRRTRAMSLRTRQSAQQQIDTLINANARLERALQEYVRREAEAQHIACHDVLTGLPNRRLLQDRLGQALAQAERSQQQVAVLFLDLDDFKAINDRLGHAAGDTVLCMVAQRLLRNVRAADTVCRYGGDEFVILLPALDDPRTVTRVTSNLRAALSVPYVVDSFDIHLRVTAGVAIYAGKATSKFDLIERADRALYCGKTERCNARIINHAQFA